MNDNKGFWNRWAVRYDRLMSGEKDTYAQILNRMKKKLNRNMVVLELACGTGIMSVKLAGSVKQLEATDFSEDMIKQAKQKNHSSRLHFSVQDATALPYASGSFDAVIIFRFYFKCWGSKSICKQVQTAAYHGSNHGISATRGFISHGYPF